LKNYIVPLIAVAIVAVAAGCAANKAGISAKGNSSVSSSGEIEIPYKGLGQFVGKDGTLDREECSKEMQRQNKEYYQKCREEALRKERELPRKNFSIWSGLFYAIKENYWDEREED